MTSFPLHSNASAKGSTKSNISKTGEGDLAKLEIITDDTLTTQLRDRFLLKRTVNRIGSSVYVSVANKYESPRKTIPQETSSLSSDHEQSNNVVWDEFAKQLVRHISIEHVDQSVVFLGEVGSGKTVTREYLTTSILTAAAAQSPSSTSVKLAEQLEAASYLISGFTHAKTVTSHSASRVGLYIELEFDAVGDAIGTKILDYRLEKRRLAHLRPGERNFNVLYWLIAGTSAAEREHLELSPNMRYRYLGHPSLCKIPGLDDAANFAKFKSAFRKLGVPRSDIPQMCQLIAAIIHLGQLEFEDKGNAEHAVVKSREELEIVSSFLGLKEDTLEVTLVHKTSWIENEQIAVMLNAKQSRERADELAETLYLLAFNWLIEHLNNRLCREDEKKNFIGLVDFGGYQYTDCGLEQLHVNIAGEFLYNCLALSFFKIPQELYADDHVDVLSFNYIDNSSCLAALTKRHNGLLAAIDNRSKKDDKSDLEFCDLIAQRFEENEYIKSNPSSLTFTVKHYVSTIEYSAIGLLDENQSTISREILVRV